MAVGVPPGIQVDVTPELDDLAGRYSFTHQPTPVVSRLRRANRVALLLLIVEKCRQERATILQLHTLDTALVDAKVRDVLRSGEAGFLPEASIRLDPALTRAVDLAVGFGLVEWVNGDRLQLTNSGRAALARIRSADLFAEERGVLSSIPGKVSMASVGRFARSRRWA